jgi:ribosomal-protein-serine acetyltransferase
MTSDNLTLRAIRATDADAFFALVDKDREDLALYFPLTTARTKTPTATSTYIHELIGKSIAKEMFCFLVFEDGRTEPIGAVIMKSFDHRVGKCELAYFISSDHRGKGIATAALMWAADEAFRVHGIQRLFLRVDPENVASIRVAEKSGFVREGLLRKDFRRGDGRLLDVVVLGRLRSAH